MLGQYPALKLISTSLLSSAPGKMLACDSLCAIRMVRRKRIRESECITLLRSEKTDINNKAMIKKKMKFGIVIIFAVSLIM